MIAILNYGLGNITAFANVYKRLNIPVVVASSPAELKNATHLILPGVGSFDHAMELFNLSGMREPVEKLVRGQAMPILGICVGMQMLANASSEGCEPGLGWIEGKVSGFVENPCSAQLPLPHMGWNDVSLKGKQSLFRGLENDTKFYFLHSYYFACQNDADIAATANYGFDFACAVNRGNVYGVQCHPEKSHHWGMTLLKNFSEL